MSGTLITIIVGVAIILLTLVYIDLPFVRNSYKRMSKEKLIEAKVRATMMERRLLISQFIYPALVIFPIFWLEGRVELYLFNAAILLSLLIGSAKIAFWRIRIITTVEIEIRKT